MDLYQSTDMKHQPWLVLRPFLEVTHCQLSLHHRAISVKINLVLAFLAN